MPVPRFRPLVKVVPHKIDDKDVFVVEDPQEGIFEHQVVLPPLAFVVAAFLDGNREIAEVQQAIKENLEGAEVEEEDVRAVIADLDQHYLLESDRLQARRREIAEGYSKSPVRPSKFVQGGREEVSKQLEEYYQAEAGAGKPGSGGGPALSAIVAPHIDYTRGGSCYTFAYKELAERSDADVYVVLGVAHVSPRNPFVVSRKGYETPFGVAEADKEILAALEKRLGDSIYEHESFHRSEHSVEFQAVFLKKARPEAKFTIVPILCSAFDMWCGANSPSTVPRIEDFLGALREATADRNVCLIAGVDFAHVGPVFGDDVEIDQKLIDWMTEGDNRSLQRASEGNAEGFWNTVMSDGNARHYCGLSATYAMLRLLDGAQGKLHKYGFAPDPQGGLVSFASMSFEPKSRIVLA